MIPIVQSIGITPAVKVIEYKPSAEQSATFNVYNNEDEAFNAKIEFRGGLSEFFVLKENTIYIPADKKLTPFDIVINMPEKLEKPGFYSTDIIVTKQPLTSIGEGKTQIGTSPSVTGKLNIRVPYPGKYIEARLVVESSEEDARFIMPVFNYGKESTEVNANIGIYEQDKIADIKTNSILLGKNSQGKLEAKWPCKKGNYDATANINYDGKVIELKKNFDIGSVLMNITRIFVENFQLGKIAKFNIHLKNIWNKENDVHCELSIIDKDGNEILKSETDSKIIQPYAEDEITAYLDTANLQRGIYDLKILTYYNGAASEKIIEVTVSGYGIKGLLIETPSAITKEGPVLLLIFIVIALVAYLVYSLKKPKKTKKAGKKR